MVVESARYTGNLAHPAGDGLHLRRDVSEKIYIKRYCPPPKIGPDYKPSLRKGRLMVIDRKSRPPNTEKESKDVESV